MSWRSHTSAGLRRIALISVLATATVPTARAEDVPAPADLPFFRLRVIDDATSRGIPAVRVSTTDDDAWWTDSAGVVAFHRPDLMNQIVFLRFDTYGYTTEPDGFGIRGQRVHVVPGASATVQMHRENIAERLYRITGADPYLDSESLGDPVPPVPVADPASIPPLGQDGGLASVYSGKMFWLWGDTNVSDYALGIYKGTAAVSRLPADGGLPPDIGVQYEYFRDAEGRVRPIAAIEHEGPVWLATPLVVRDGSRERMFSTYVKIRNMLEAVEHGIARFNDETGFFEQALSLGLDSVIIPDGFPFRRPDPAGDWFYFQTAFPTVRVPARADALTSPATYQALTCLKQGSRFDGTKEQLARDAQGRLQWQWLPDTSPVGEPEMRKLVQSGAITEDERWFRLIDFESGDEIIPHHGSIEWNPWRKRWISIRGQSLGRSWLGETWYFEADTPLGPWIYGRRILTHANKALGPYSFYNPVQIPQFDQQGGRIIYLQGAFANTFTQTPPIPRYNYNMLMHRLDLADPRLVLPVPVYESRGGDITYGTCQMLKDAASSPTLDIVWMAPDRPAEGLVPLVARPRVPGQTVWLELAPEPSSDAQIVCYALPPGDVIPNADKRGIVELYGWTNEQTGEVRYGPAGRFGEGWRQGQQPVARAWRMPLRFDPLLLEPHLVD